MIRLMRLLGGVVLVIARSSISGRHASHRAGASYVKEASNNGSGNIFAQTRGNGKLGVHSKIPDSEVE